MDQRELKRTIIDADRTIKRDQSWRALFILFVFIPTVVLAVAWLTMPEVIQDIWSRVWR